DPDVVRLPDLGVDVVGELIEVDEEIDRAANADFREEIDLVGAAAEAGAPQEVLDLLFTSSHAKPRCPAPSPLIGPRHTIHHRPAFAKRVPMRFETRMPGPRRQDKGRTSADSRLGTSAAYGSVSLPLKTRRRPE